MRLIGEVKAVFLSLAVGSDFFGTGFGGMKGSEQPCPECWMNWWIVFES